MYRFSDLFRLRDPVRGRNAVEVSVSESTAHKQWATCVQFAMCLMQVLEVRGQLCCISTMQDAAFLLPR